MTIDFEKDQQDAMKRTDNIQSLADQVEKLESLQKRQEKTNRIFIWRSNSNHDGRDGFITS